MFDSQESRNSKMEELDEKFGWMKSQGPCFSLNGDHVSVIEAPCDFYGTLKDMVQNAKRRIVIASLFLGTDEHEKELVKSIEAACAKSEKTEDFEVTILFDYLRGSRGRPNNSRSMLIPLLQKYETSVHVYLYHTPDLRGLLKKYVPERHNEIIGLTHIKVYVADDAVIISGANLSEPYFTNKQDRYMHFRQCTEFCDYLVNIVKAIAHVSFKLQSDNSTVYPSTSPHPYDGTHPSSVFKWFAAEKVNEVKDFQMQSLQTKHALAKHSHGDTWLFPLMQMWPFGIRDDERVTKELIGRAESRDTLYLATGYLNLPPGYMEAVLSGTSGRFKILTASPESNGFFGASGISGYVPDVYTNIAKEFHARVHGQRQDKRITVLEYVRPRWTFHAKGLWYYMPDIDLPVMTMIGSPNFGYRSVYKDLECQIVVMTTNTELRKQLDQERRRLYGSSFEVITETFEHPKRQVPWLVRFITNYIKGFF